MSVPSHQRGQTEADCDGRIFTVATIVPSFLPSMLPWQSWHSITNDTSPKTLMDLMRISRERERGRAMLGGIRRALSERCQYAHVHSPVRLRRPPGFVFCIRACLPSEPSGRPRILAQCPSGSNARKSPLKAPSVRQPRCPSISPALSLM